MYISFFESPLGRIELLSNGTALCGLYFEGQKYHESVTPDAENGDGINVILEAKRWLAIYFSGIKPDFTPPIMLSGSEFRKEVWERLSLIPYGKTTAYGQIASEIAKAHGSKRISAQAVGGAVGHNPVSIIVPCHRVIAANGSLSGYAGGLNRKIALLKLEGIDTDKLVMPRT